MKGQIDIFEYMDETSCTHYCINCKRAKFKEKTRNGIEIYFCNDTRQFITEKSLDWICRKSKGHSLYERR